VTAVRSRLRLRDQGADAAASIAAAPGRSAAAAIATALGIAAGVATVLVGLTARHQVSAEFDALRATQVLVEAASEAPGLADDPLRGPFPSNVGSRLAPMPGVVAAGLVTEVAQEVAIATTSLPDPDGHGTASAPVVAADAGALAAAGVALDGRSWPGFREPAGARVALVGRALAQRLDLGPPAGPQTVLVDGIPFAHLGVIEDVHMAPALLDAVVVPPSTARALWATAPRTRTEALVRVVPGAGSSVAERAVVALRPDDPRALAATGPADPTALRERVEAQVQLLFLSAAGIALLVGALGIASATTVSVLERRSELALRRALGARPAHLARHVLTEAAAVGILSGIGGTVLGLGGLAAVCWQQRWVPIVDPRLVLSAPAVGGAVGVVAGW
jgi:putative ABC transport system permease protein